MPPSVETDEFQDLHQQALEEAVMRLGSVAEPVLNMVHQAVITSYRGSSEHAKATAVFSPNAEARQRLERAFATMRVRIAEQQRAVAIRLYAECGVGPQLAGKLVDCLSLE